MADAALVDVLNARDDLLKEPASFCFLELLPFNDVLEQLTSGCVLHYQKKLSGSLNDLKMVKYFAIIASAKTSSPLALQPFLS